MSEVDTSDRTFFEDFGVLVESDKSSKVVIMKTRKHILFCNLVMPFEVLENLIDKKVNVVVCSLRDNLLVKRFDLQNKELFSHLKLDFKPFFEKTLQIKNQKRT